MNVKLRVWRQKNNDTEGGFENYEAKDLNPNMSFLEMLDVVNENLTDDGLDPLHLLTIVAKAFAERVPA